MAEVDDIEEGVVHCGFSALMVLHPQTPTTKAQALLQFTAFGGGSDYPHLNELVIPEDAPYSVSFYNERAFEYQGDQTVSVNGTFIANERENGFPTLHVFADKMIPIPYNPAGRMEPHNPNLFTGGVACGHHTDPSGLRMFILRITTRDESQEDEAQDQDEAQDRLRTFHIACSFPVEPHQWFGEPLPKSPVLPEIGRFVGIGGVLVGFYPWDGRQVLSVVMNNAAYL